MSFRDSIVTVICVWLFSFYSYAQITFSKIYDTNKAAEYASKVIETDSGYLVYGEGFGYPGLGNWRGMMLRKIDFEGNLVSEKLYGNPQQNWFSAYNADSKISNNQFALAGGVYDSLTNEDKALLILFDETGDTLFTKQYAVNSRFQGIRYYDSNFFLFGLTIINQTTNWDLYLVRTDSLGNELWHKTYGGSKIEAGVSIDITLDNKLIMGGGTEKFTSKPYAPWVIVSDTSGNIEWDKNYGTQSGADCGATVISSKSGGSILFSCIDTFITSGPDTKPHQIVKIDSSGEVVWRKIFDNSKERIIYNSFELLSGDILFAGLIRNDADTKDIGWLFKLDADGNEVWERKLEYIHPGPPNIRQRKCWLYDAKQTTDSGYICAGIAYFVDSNDVSDPDFWVLKLDSLGCEIPGCHVGINDKKTVTGEVVIMPNPATTHALVSIKSSKQEHTFKEAVFRLFDVSGKEIYTQTTTLNAAAYSEYYLNTSSFQAGIYFYIVTTRNEVVGKGKLAVK
jgi:predicted Rdx family selenoprotein